MSITITLKQENASGRSEAYGVLRVLCSLASRVFKCRHREMSRPFTRSGETYRACLDCGARRRFDTDNFRMTGPYYFQPPNEKR